MVHLIVGYGEVGKALDEVLGGHNLHTDKNGDSNWDTVRGTPETIDVVHLCIPYTNENDFGNAIAYYRRFCKLLIVHSSVPVGTCDKWMVVHSPIRGVHPNLAKGIRTFPKYFGGYRARVAAEIFKKLGLKVKVFKEARTTEALKLWDTTQYGRLIMLQREIYAWCKKNKVDFDTIYTMANQDYNAGYVKLGRPEVVRPWLKNMPGPIGGHCVLPNAKLLKVKL